MSGQYATPSRSHLTQKVPDGVRRYTHVETQVAANVVPAITDVHDRLVLLNSSDAIAKAITTTTAREGQRLSIFLIARSSTGTYTLAVTGGTLTFDAANEHALVERVNGAWKVLSLNGATIV